MNHPHEQQAAAMDRAGELPDGEQLRECINSGQVSAAQVVAHAESGEVTGWPAGMLQDDSRQLSKALSRDPNARALVRDAVAHQEAGELPEPFGFLLPTERSPAFHYMRRSDEKGMSVFSADQMRAAIAAERAEVARLREALENIAFAGMSPSPEMSQNGVEAWHARQAWRFIGIAARAINPTQEANHD